jgi:hypothetical protein
MIEETAIDPRRSMLERIPIGNAPPDTVEVSGNRRDHPDVTQEKWASSLGCADRVDRRIRSGLGRDT